MGGVRIGAFSIEFARSSVRHDAVRYIARNVVNPGSKGRMENMACHEEMYDGALVAPLFQQ